MIQRDIASRLVEASQAWPSITLTGPRQGGKSTLCRSLFSHLPFVTLDDPDVRMFAHDDPRAFLGQFSDGAILDEVQRVPELTSYLQGMIDDDPRPGKWILTGSFNLPFLGTPSQSLAGRTAIYNLLPLGRGEIIRFARHPKTLEESVFAGSYPEIFDRGLDPVGWYRSYVATCLERDVHLIANVSDITKFQRLLSLCAGRTAQYLNHSTLAEECSISQPTAKAWLGILEASFLVFRLPAFHTNVRKRLKRTPKLHFFDTGLVCWLLGIRTPEHLQTHPLRGAIFESWVASEIVKQRASLGETGGVFCYRDRNDAEVDLIVDNASEVTLVEAKSAQTPSSSLFDGSRRVRKQLERSAEHCPIVVVHGGSQSQRLGRDVLLPWNMLHKQDPVTFQTR